MRIYSVDTNAERLQVYLQRYLEFGLTLNYENTNFHIETILLNDHMSVSQKDASYYPVYLFYAYTDIEYAIHAVKQLTNNPSRVSNSIGTMEMIDSRADQSFLQFKKSNDLLNLVEKKVIEGISAYWRPEFIRETQDEKDLSTKSNNEIFDDPKRLGKYIKTIKYPGRIQPVEELPASDIQNSDELPYDRYLVQSWGEVISVDQICRNIKDKGLGSINAPRARNRITELRRLHPDWKIPYRKNNFKKK